MKLALTAYLHGAGGAERQIILLANELSLRGHNVYIIILSENKSPYHISDKVNIIDLSIIENKKKSIINRFLALRRTLINLKPEITINYNFQGAYFCLLIGKKWTGKILYSERGDPYDKEYSGLLGLVRDISVKRIDAFVFQSEGARNYFKLRKDQHSIVIHNSVSVPQDKYPIVNNRDKTIVSVGRLHPQKNLGLLIDAFARISNTFSDYSLDIYGDGEMKDELQLKINDLGLNGKIHLNSSRKDIFDCIRSASLFVLSSDYEGMPNALMEAMALGLPCISTDCRPGGARTLIQDGINGYIVPIKDIEALASKMMFLLNNKEISERIAAEARKISVTHTNFLVFNKWNDFLLKL